MSIALFQLLPFSWANAKISEKSVVCKSQGVPASIQVLIHQGALDIFKLVNGKKIIHSISELGTGFECFELKNIGPDLFALSLNRGSSGTSTLVQSHSLVILRFEPSQWRELADFTYFRKIYRNGQWQVMEDSSFDIRPKENEELVINFKSKLTNESRQEKVIVKKI
jgi:hypothetical protein